MKLSDLIYWSKSRQKGLFWVRIFTGHGLYVKNIRVNGLDFSERYNLKKTGCRLGNYYVELLLPFK